MEFAKSKETTERPSDDSSSLGPDYERIIEHAWLLKSAMRWVRNDRNPLNAFRWFVWDRSGIGDPPSRVERVAAGEVTTVTDDPVPILPNLSNRQRVQAHRRQKTPALTAAPTALTASRSADDFGRDLAPVPPYREETGNR
jgi:hypothetical protein